MRKFIGSNAENFISTSSRLASLVVKLAGGFFQMNDYGFGLACGAGGGVGLNS
jgi:hypothetical protein